MARPRSFDADVVLDKAAEAFRKKGYEATSLTDLEKATGLGRASLYAAFQGKHQLYLSALKRYDANIGSRLLAQLDAEPTGRRALEKLFDLVVAQCAADPAGCLLNNAAMERGNTDAAAGKCVEENRKRVEGAIRACVLRGCKDGSLHACADASAAARLLFAVVLGLRALAKSGSSKEQMADVARLALKAV